MTVESGRVDLCGIPVDCISLEQLLDSCMRLAGRPEPDYICYVNAHVHNLARRNRRLRLAIRNSTICYADGHSIVWACRLHGIVLPGRMTGADFFPDLLKRLGQLNLRIYFLGGKPGVAERAAHYLRFQPVGVQHGYFAADDNHLVCKDIRSKSPDILLVGMGSPKQEEWIAAHLEDLKVPLAWCVGALFDYSAGLEPRCPHWMGQFGLEWLYRLMIHPRKRAKRYLIGNPRFCRAILRSLWHRIFRSN